MIDVILNSDESAIAQIVGEGRYRRAREKHRVYVHSTLSQGEVAKLIDTDVQGVAAEIAFAKHFDRYPSFGMDLDFADVAGCHIRSTTCLNGRAHLCLFKHLNEHTKKLKEPSVLVIVRAPVYQLAGWAWGHEIVQDENWQAWMPRPTWGIAQGNLRNIESVPLRDRVEIEKAAPF